MFDKLEMAPPDAILGLNEAFNEDTRPTKINLGVGVYKDADGNTPVFDCVKEAERRILDTESSKGYLGIPGDADYAAATQKLLFGEDHEIVASARARAAQTPGGTGALRVAGDFIKQQVPGAAIWMSDPTWANHPKVFQSAGVEVKTYPYYDADAKCLDFDAMMAAIAQIPEGDVILLHGCCHNPTGMDPTPEQWAQIADAVYSGKLLPLLDFAYQGLADGLTEDAVGLKALSRPGCEMLVCSSFSKNFGLYCERVGALTIVGATPGAADKAFSHVKTRIRTNYSNPPKHGGAIVAEVLADPELSAAWHEDVKAMRDRINGMRRLFVDTLKAKGVTRDFSFITRQKGMFSFSGLTKDQVEKLRDGYGIYIVGSGRINVAGMTEANMDGLCEAIAAVL